MIGQNSLIHVSLSYRIGLDIIPLDTIPNTRMELLCVQKIRQKFMPYLYTLHSSCFLWYARLKKRHFL